MGWAGPYHCDFTIVTIQLLLNMAPAYLEELCWPVSDIGGRRHLRSARRGLLDVPRVELLTYGRRSFSYAGPSAWNAVPDYLKNSTVSVCLQKPAQTFSFLIVLALPSRSRLSQKRAICITYLFTDE